MCKIIPCWKCSSNFENRNGRRRYETFPIFAAMEKRKYLKHLQLWQFSFIRNWLEIQKSEIHPSVFCPISGDWDEIGIPNLARMSLMKSYWNLQNDLILFAIHRDSNLCEDVLIIYNGHIFFSKKVSKKCSNQSFCKNSHFFRTLITTNQIANSGLFFFQVIHLILLLHLEHIFLKKRASNVWKIHSFCKSGFNHFWKIQVTFLKNFLMLRSKFWSDHG